MSTFFKQEEIYVTEEELEKTYNYIKNMIDSKISQIQRSLVEIEKRLQQKELIVHPDMKQQILDINTKITETEKIRSKIVKIDELIENTRELRQKIDKINEEINKESMLTKQEISSLYAKIELMEEKLRKTEDKPVDTLDITMQLEQMTEQTANKKQIELLTEQLKQIEERIKLQDSNLLKISNNINPQEAKFVEINNKLIHIKSNMDLQEDKFIKIQKDITVQNEKIIEMKNSISDDSTRQNGKGQEILKKLQEQMDLQTNKIEAEIKERVEDKLFEQNVEVQKVEQLLTLKMNKNSDDARSIREEIEKVKLKIEEIELEWKYDESNRATHYEIEQLNQKLLQINNTLKNSQTRQEINELIEQKIKIKQEELENQFRLEKEELEEQLITVQNEFEKKIKIAQEENEKEIKSKKEEIEKENEEKIRKIVEEMIAKQREEQEKNTKAIPQEPVTQISQILATIK